MGLFKKYGLNTTLWMNNEKKTKSHRDPFSCTSIVGQQQRG